MLIKVKVIPKARVNDVSKEGDFFKVRVTAPPEKGKANKAVINLISKYFNAPKTQIMIEKGKKNRIKEIKIY